MPAHHPIKLGRKAPGGGIVRVRYLTGEPLRGTRGQSEAGGAPLPAGSQAFRVPRGSVRTGDYLEWAGQVFRCVGVEPLPPFFTRDRLTCNRVAANVP